MNRGKNRSVAVIGAGPAGLLAADVLQKRGFTATVFEKSPRHGGVWSHAYKNASLQNTWMEYTIPDFPWPFERQLHPTAEEIMRYLDAFVEDRDISVQYSTEVTLAQPLFDLKPYIEGKKHVSEALGELDASPDSHKWAVTVRSADGKETTKNFHLLHICSGHYTGQQKPIPFSNAGSYKGEIMTERSLKSYGEFKGRSVVVVGNGKTALDMAMYAAEHGASRVQHVFRTPRWGLPRYILGLHFTWLLFNRVNTTMMPSWGHGLAFEQLQHRFASPVVSGFWWLVSKVVTLEYTRHGFGHSDEVKRRIRETIPTHPLKVDLRSAAAVIPDEYFSSIVSGRIEPIHASITSFSSSGIRIKRASSGNANFPADTSSSSNESKDAKDEELVADMIVVSIGTTAPRYPFFPKELQIMLSQTEDKGGLQLFRHVVHPRLPFAVFGGYNQGFLFMPAATLGALWSTALWNGEISLPSTQAMEASIARISEWKRNHISFESSLLSAVSTRYQQYLDVMMLDLGLSRFRKLPNPIAEVFGRYGGADYDGALQTYLSLQAKVDKNTTKNAREVQQVDM